MKEIMQNADVLEPDRNCWDKLPTLSTALWICSTLSRPLVLLARVPGYPGNVIQNAYSLKQASSG